MLHFAIDERLILTLLLIMARVGTITIFAPFFSVTTFGVQVRVYLTLFLSVALLPVVHIGDLPTPMPFLGWGVLFIQEALIGLGVGLVMRMILAGVQMTGHLIGFQIGYSFVNVIDPQTAVQTSTLTVFLNFIAVVIFVLMNGHHFVIAALAGSFTHIPPMHAAFGRGVFDAVSSAAGTIFVLGLQLATPMLFLLVLLDVVVGIIGRVAPQVPILIIAFPLKVIVGIASLGVGLAYFRDSFQHFLILFEGDVGSLLRAFAHG